MIGPFRILPIEPFMLLGAEDYDPVSADSQGALYTGYIPPATGLQLPDNLSNQVSVLVQEIAQKFMARQDVYLGGEIPVVDYPLTGAFDTVGSPNRIKPLKIGIPAMAGVVGRGVRLPLAPDALAKFDGVQTLAWASGPLDLRAVGVLSGAGADVELGTLSYQGGTINWELATAGFSDLAGTVEAIHLEVKTQPADDVYLLLERVSLSLTPTPLPAPVIVE